MYLTCQEHYEGYHGMYPANYGNAKKESDSVDITHNASVDNTNVDLVGKKSSQYNSDSILTWCTIL